jgi:uncharacterized protein YidB (DUF937 family)
MDILLGGLAGNSPLGKLLSGKNAPIFLALLPALLGLLGGKNAQGQSGLHNLVGTFQAGGLGDIVNSWVGGGPNKKITPTQVKKSLGEELLGSLASQSGLPLGDVTKGLSQLLPVVVNELTPKAQVPAASALEEALQGLSGLLPKS